MKKETNQIVQVSLCANVIADKLDIFSFHSWPYPPDNTITIEDENINLIQQLRARITQLENIGVQSSRRSTESSSGQVLGTDAESRSLACHGSKEGSGSSSGKFHVVLLLNQKQNVQKCRTEVS